MTDALAERLREALRAAREFIDDIVPGWYLAKQRMLAEIDAALSPAAPSVGQEGETQ